MIAAAFDTKTRAKFAAKTRMASSPKEGMRSACLEWVANRNFYGYGRFYVNGKFHGAHRVAWEMKNGAIPDGMFVCHRCDNPACVRVGHLFIGTIQENNYDKDLKRMKRSVKAYKAELAKAKKGGEKR